MKLKNAALTFLTAAMLTLAGCGNEKAGEKAAKDAPSLADVSKADAQKMAAQAAINALPVGDRSRPLDSYTKLDSNNQLMFAYYAVAGMPLDYDKLLKNYSQEYANTNDEFKRSDIKAALQPRIQAEVEKAKSDRHLKFTWRDLKINPYNFESKTFSQGDLAADSYFGWSDGHERFNLSFTNAEKFQSFIPPDEAVARNIESLRANWRQYGTPFDMRIYGFVQGADVSRRFVNMQIMTVEIVDKKGNLLMKASL